MDLLSLWGWAPVLAVLAAALIARRFSPPPVRAPLARWAAGPWLPATVGLLSAAALWYVWGGWHPVPFIHDEASYLLEAETLARGHFTAPAPPLPAFFEQFHVFTTPVLASRYPPGWPLALVPGIWLGVPALVPLLLTALTGALLTVLVRRLAGPVAALAAWCCWIAPPIALRFRPAFLSEHLSTFLWLAGLWALWNWRADRRTRWLVILAVTVAWDGITRPFTAIAFALPVGVLVLHDVIRWRAWRALGIAVAAALPLCALVPLQDLAVTGHWDRLPMSEYSVRYAPFDLPGFGLNTTHPTDPLSEFQKGYNNGFRPLHPQHVVERIREILAARLSQFVGQSAGPWGTVGLLALALFGLVVGGVEIAFAGLAAAALFLLYLDFAHPDHWVAYYMEAHLVYVAAVAIGAERLARVVMTRSLRAHPAGIDTVLLLLLAYLAVGVPGSLAVGRGARARIGAPNQMVRELELQLPAPAILFIRYGPQHRLERNFIENHYDLAATPVWRVHDLGVRNVELLRLAPGRRAFLYDEGTGAVTELGPDGAPLPATGPSRPR